MPGAYLYGWDTVNSLWVKLKCDADGKVILDPESRYTDAKALAACGLDGTLYWSCPGVHFQGSKPHLNEVERYSEGYIKILSGSVYLRGSVNLPDGATITSVVVYGNAQAEDSSWRLQRIKLADRTTLLMATNAVNSADNTITGPVVNNSLYAYLLFCQTMVTDDEIWGARITYTI